MRTKIFIGYPVPKELKGTTSPLADLTIVNHKGKQYLGHFLESSKMTTADLRLQGRALGEKIQPFTVHALDLTHCVLFADILLG